jgi:type II secretory pathway component PulM
MNTLFDKLNLRPQERRLVMVAAAVVFVVLNVWLVIPHFNRWKDVLTKLRQARETLARYQAESNKTGEYKQSLEQLQNDGLWVVPDDQSLTLMQMVQTKAASANVYVTRISPAGGGTIPNNPFFEEQRVTMTAVAGEAELVEFLRSLGVDNSLIRVRDMDLKPDLGGVKLSASLTIVGNYLKKPGAKPTSPTRPGPRGANPNRS